MVTGVGGRDEFIKIVNIELCPISLQIHPQLNQGFLAKASFIVLMLNFTNTENREGGTSGWKARKEARRRRQKWDWRKKKKKKQEAATECFLVSSGGLAFVWNENSECLRDYSRLAGLWEPTSYLYTSNTEYGNHHSVCVYAKKCVSPIMNWWVAIQTNTQWSEWRSIFIWPHLSHLYRQHLSLKYLKI